MLYPIVPLFCRPWTLNGFTPHLIESHMKAIAAKLTRLNAIVGELEALSSATASAHAIAAKAGRNGL